MSSVNAHTRIARSSAHCSGRTRVCMIAARRLPGSGSLAVLQALPRASCMTPQALDQRRPVFGHVGEVPVEAAFGDVELFAQSTDAQCIRSAVGKHGEARLDPIIGRQLAAEAARRRHRGQHTSVTDTCENYSTIVSGKHRRRYVTRLREVGNRGRPAEVRRSSAPTPARPAVGLSASTAATVATAAPYHTRWYGAGRLARKDTGAQRF